MQYNDFHSFFIYVFFGYFLIYPAVIVSLRILKIHDPGQRMKFYLLALITPFLGFALYHTVLAKQCQGGIFPEVPGSVIFNTFCYLGTKTIYYLGPLLVIMLFIGLLKTVAAALLVARIRRHAIVPDPAKREMVVHILHEQCTRLGLEMPEVIFSKRGGFAAFTAGLLRPVIVINAWLLSDLGDKELKAVLTHELVHIYRGDTRSCWLLRLAQNIMFFSPFSKVIVDRYLLENELLCDRETIRLVGSKDEYAATILKVWRLFLSYRGMKTELGRGFLGSKRDMELRVVSLLEEGKKGEKRSVFLVGTLLATLSLAIIFYLGFIC
ncbi:MAG: M56 family metallopeptidase [Bacillota bacterium]|nr:M56 family metallopeptidase [Bacillota bacterium]